MTQSLRRLARACSPLLLGVAAGAGAFDLPSLNLGFTSFLDGAPPSGPGWYFQEYLQYYEADKLADGNGDAVYAPTPSGLQKHKVDAFVAMTQLIYQSDTPLVGGGKWGINFMLPLVNLDVSPGDSLAIQANDTGFGDLLVGPFLQWDPIMGADGPLFMHRVEFQVVLPTGSYDADHELNPGSNHWSFDPYWAGTLFFTPRWSASWRLHYLWNGENDDPSNRTRFAIRMARPDLPVNDIRPGQAVHLNFASEYEVLPKQFRVGLNGYYLEQLTDTEVDGEKLSGRKEQVWAIGPGAVWHLTPDTHLFGNLYFESGAENRPEGTRVNLRLVHHF